MTAPPGRYAVDTRSGLVRTDDPELALELAAANRRVTVPVPVPTPMLSTVAARTSQLARARTGEPSVLHGRPVAS
jgi:hypothetical protein